jgi:drug/metabolite transporter (DMT)-like permease
MALALVLLSTLGFGTALVTGRMGLRTMDARSGAAISIPTAAALFLVTAPFVLDLTAFDVRAALLFAVVGLFFPAVVTLLTFRSNELLGPTVTGAVSGTAPLFALLGAALFLDEQIPSHAAVSAAGVVAGVALLSWRKEGALPARFVGWPLLWPVAGAIVRGLAQVGAKAGLLLWGNPFAAGLIGYTISSATVIGADRLRRGKRKWDARAAGWFAATGVLNGGALLLLYFALSMAPVWMVAPVVAGYPLVTAIVSTVLLRDEKLSLRVVAGAVITVLAIAWLVASHAGR